VTEQQIVSQDVKNDLDSLKIDVSCLASSAMYTDVEDLYRYLEDIYDDIGVLLEDLDKLR
jgi:hypothetical protein